jgi:hypothetical protein
MLWKAVRNDHFTNPITVEGVEDIGFPKSMNHTEANEVQTPSRAGKFILKRTEFSSP